MDQHDDAACGMLPRGSQGFLPAPKHLVYSLATAGTILGRCWVKCSLAWTMSIVHEHFRLACPVNAYHWLAGLKFLKTFFVPFHIGL